AGQAIDDFSDRLAQPVASSGRDAGEIKCIDDEQDHRGIGVSHFIEQNLAVRMREQLVIRKRARERDVELALQKTAQQFLGKLSVTAIYGATLGSVFTPLGQKYFVAEVERY